MVCAETPPPISTCATVLLIDDNEEDLKYWSDIVRNSASNYTVLKAKDGRAGLAICRDQRVDCVLLDLDMPESGFQTLVKLIPHSQHPEIAVVILTHLVHPFLSDVASVMGAQAWLVKKYTSAEELDAAIQQAVTRFKSRE